MIINTGQRTDIPAFYPEWFMNRIKEGFVCVRNPFHAEQVSRYELNPDIVDCIGFCTKNPAPMLPYLNAIRAYGQFWYVTITGYGTETEPNVPPYPEVIKSFQELSRTVGENAVGWRYDPIFINGTYSIRYHLSCFETIANALSGYTHIAVISFIDIFRKVTLNFPGVRPVTGDERRTLGKEMVSIAQKYGMELYPCGEGTELEKYGANCGGCMTAPIYEKAIGCHLKLPKGKENRTECACYLTCDIGQYDTCLHLCKYCYANRDHALVKQNHRLHDPNSPLLIGHLKENDQIHQADQVSFKDYQMKLSDFL
ncbi:MAG: DUF1848 domain-containing protein [Lachnospiraceae bacterium]|nr:DUF1848 domain-containing protein [Lachnospiraceae bacterium]